MIEFAVPHTLAFTFFPAWVSSLHEKFGPKSRLIALNVHDAVMRLVVGGCDLLIATTTHPSLFSWMPTATKWSAWGGKCCRPTASPTPMASRCSCLPGRAGQPLPYLGYAPGAYLGRVTS